MSSGKPLSGSGSRLDAAPVPAKSWFEWIRSKLERLFSAVEVDRDIRLKVIGAGLLFYFHMTFHYWSERAIPLSTMGDEVFNFAPASLIQNARWLIFMDLFQTKTYLYVLGMLALLGMFLLFVSRSSLPALLVLLWLFINKVFYYLADFRLFSNFHHFHLLYTLVFLVAQDKLRFIRLTLALSYILSGLVKLSPSWLLGEYFNSLPNKLPLLPKWDWLVTSACVGVVILELVGPLCWFFRLRWLRRLTFGAFILFHIYSGVIVGYWYTTLMLPVVVAAFWEFDQPLLNGYQFSKRHLVPMGVCAMALFGGVYHYLIPGDVRLTGEGRYFGLFMFDATHSVRFRAEIRKDNKLWEIQVLRNWEIEPGESRAVSRISCVFHQDDVPVEHFYVAQPIRDGDEIIFNPQYFMMARMRICGDPYLYYFYSRELVRRYAPDQVSVVMEQRLDGKSETMTIFDIPDFEELDPSYHSFRHNPWIQTGQHDREAEGAKKKKVPARE